MASYALSRKELPFRNAIMMFFTITMLFGGGMIPTFLVVQGLGMLFGFWYDMTAQVSAQWFYMFYPAMHIVDVLFGLAYLALAAGAFYTRQQLAQFRKNGPDLYYLFIIAATVLGFLYTVLQGIVCATAAGLLAAIVEVVVKVVLLVLCRMYFEKRRHLFCN